MSGCDPKNCRRVEDLPVVKENVQRNISIYVFDNQEGEYMGDIAWGIFVGFN